jgi:hypothetical protein
MSQMEWDDKWLNDPRYKLINFKVVNLGVYIVFSTAIGVDRSILFSSARPGPISTRGRRSVMVVCSLCTKIPGTNSRF